MDNSKLYFGSGMGDQHHVVDEGTGRTVALTYNDDGGATAEEIAKRWNAFPELVKFVGMISRNTTTEEAECEDLGNDEAMNGLILCARQLLNTIEHA